MAVSSVTTYGAVGDGSTHPLSEFYGSLGAAQAVYSFATSLSQEIDWAATQKAINEAAASSSICRVLIPAGSYFMSDQIVISTNNIELVGEGNDSILNCHQQGNIAAIKIDSGAVNTVLSRWALRHFRMTRSLGSRSGTAIQVNRGWYCEIDGLNIQKFDLGVELKATDQWNAGISLRHIWGQNLKNGIKCGATGGQTNAILIEDCHIYGENDAGSIGIDMINGDTSIVMGGDIDSFETAGIVRSDRDDDLLLRARCENCATFWVYEDECHVTSIATKTSTITDDESFVIESAITPQSSILLNNAWLNNTVFLKTRDSGGAKQDFIGSDASNNTIVRGIGPLGGMLLKWGNSGGTVSNRVQCVANVADPNLDMLDTPLIVGNRAALPTASSALRGATLRVEGGAGVADVLYLCIKNASDGYEWKVVTLA